ncbi:MAG: prepilin-type N-terminal cleavage/methylation domain-containing protein [Phycisphaera sp.]|nr:prepilin-type N-terminal cleavage/methylation domain-containing protein [Phycisphaera sp.]
MLEAPVRATRSRSQRRAVEDEDRGFRGPDSGRYGGEGEKEEHWLGIMGLRVETSWDDPQAFRGWQLPPRRHRGFTLVEILIVCSLIVLLLSIVLPSFAGARERARLAVCAANMSQLGKQTQDYLVDSFQRMPITGGFQAMHEFSNMTCPNDPDPWTMPADISGFDDDMSMSIGMNTEFYVWLTTHMQIDRPSDVCVYFDGTPALGPQFTVDETFTSGINWTNAGNGMPKVDILHRPPGNPENLRPITIAITALPAHIRHGCLFGAFDTNRVDVGANISTYFVPRHPVSYDVGNVLFADWHVDYQIGLTDQNFMFPGGGSVSTTITRTPVVPPNPRGHP